MVLEASTGLSQHDHDLYLTLMEMILSRSLHVNTRNPLVFDRAYDPRKLPDGVSIIKFNQICVWWMLHLIKGKNKGQLSQQLNALAAGMKKATNAKDWVSLDRQSPPNIFIGNTSIDDRIYRLQLYPTLLIAVPALNYQTAEGVSANYPPQLLVVEHQLVEGVLTSQFTAMDFTSLEPPPKELITFQTRTDGSGIISGNFDQQLYRVEISAMPTTTSGLTRTIITLNNGVSFANPVTSPAILGMTI